MKYILMLTSFKSHKWHYLSSTGSELSGPVSKAKGRMLDLNVAQIEISALFRLGDYIVLDGESP